MSPKAVIALALLVGIVGAVVMVWRARRESKRLEDEVRRVLRQVEAKRREVEVETQRAHRNQRRREVLGRRR
jgi:uncharacterized membrane-anchored protein YhcB (DUF1043 family)